MDTTDSAKMIHFQEDSNGVSSKLFCSLKNLIKKGKVYKIKFRSGAFAGDEIKLVASSVTSRRILRTLVMTSSARFWMSVSKLFV